MPQILFCRLFPHPPPTHSFNPQDRPSSFQESCFLRCSHASMAHFQLSHCSAASPFKTFFPSSSFNPQDQMMGLGSILGPKILICRLFPDSFSPQDHLSCHVLCAVLANLYSALPVVPLIMPRLPSTPFCPAPQFHDSQDHHSIAQYSARKVIAQTMRLAVVGDWTCCAK